MSRWHRQRSGLKVEAVEGAAERAGVRAGDRLVAVDGWPVTDALDLEYAAADGRFQVDVERGGERLCLEIDVGSGQGHGLLLEGGLGQPARTCRNTCHFCFVDQLPPGLRPTLYVKDDDYRLSFLEGSFITLSNMDDADLRRVQWLRLSPLYVSLHAWDDAVRVALMGTAARGTRLKLQRLGVAGIELHVQVVLCPGWNDGEVLRETLDRLGDVGGVVDVGVVPVSLATEGRLRRLTPEDAAAAIQVIEAVQAVRRSAGRSAFAHAADELYLLAGRLPPAADAMLQYENGVGIVDAFMSEAAQIGRRRSRRSGPDLALLCGTLAEPVVGRACRRLGRARPFVVVNRLFGPHVTVTGLLGGREVVAALQRAPLTAGEWLLAPRSFLPAHLGRTLDDVPTAALAEAAGGRFVVADSLMEAVTCAESGHRAVCHGAFGTLPCMDPGAPTRPERRVTDPT